MTEQEFLEQDCIERFKFWKEAYFRAIDIFFRKDRPKLYWKGTSVLGIVYASSFEGAEEDLIVNFFEYCGAFASLSWDAYKNEMYCINELSKRRSKNE